MCEIELTNIHSNNAIPIKKNEKVVGHVPKALEEKLHPLMKTGMSTELPPLCLVKKEKHRKKHERNRTSMYTSDCPGGNRNFNINNNAQ